MIWSVMIVPAVVLAIHGWRPEADDTLIALRTWWVFSNHTPLVGTASTASGAHQAFGLGPLQFWLLAVPIRLDMSQGLLFGATFWCGLALSLTVEAAWRTTGWPGCLVIALVTADLAWQTPILSNLVWNPDFGLFFLIATATFAWAVAAGSFRWWPPAVVAGSIAAQSHVFYLLPAVALIVAAPLVAVAARRPARYRWLVTGLALGALCWVLPCAQELFGHPGNISVLLGSPGSRRIGLGFGLRALSMAGSLHPIWLTSYPYLVAIGNQTPSYINRFSEVWGIFLLMLIMAITVFAWRAKNRSLAILATIVSIWSVTTVAAFALFPTGPELGVVVYLITALWVLGISVWIVVVWAAFEVVRAICLRTQALDAIRRSNIPLLTRTGAAALALLILVGAALKGTMDARDGASSTAARMAVGAPLNLAIADVIERHVPRWPVVVVNVQPSLMRITDDHGLLYAPDYWSIGYQLVADGWRPALPASKAQPSGLTLPRRAPRLPVTVELQPGRLAIAGIRVGPISR